MTASLIGIRSLLFLPASNPRAIAKAREAGADLVILDLEDAVKPEDKVVARDAAVEAAGSDWPCPVAIRVNGTASEWHDADVAAVARSGAPFAVLPRVEGGEELAHFGSLAGRPVLAMIETPAGVLRAEGIAAHAAGLIAGTNDLRSSLRLPPSAGRETISASLQWIVLAARAARVPAFDGVFNGLEDLEGFAEECRQGRLLGFDGKSLIHPKQIEPCHAAFAATPEELAQARRLLEAATGGAERFEGQMIERMHVETARRLVRQG